jgi:hypothetical protein
VAKGVAAGLPNPLTQEKQRWRSRFRRHGLSATRCARGHGLPPCPHARALPETQPASAKITLFVRQDTSSPSDLARRVAPRKVLALLVGFASQNGMVFFGSAQSASYANTSVAVDQQREHHTRRILPASCTPLIEVQRPGIHPLYCFQNKVYPVFFRHPFA